MDAPPLDGGADKENEMDRAGQGFQLLGEQRLLSTQASQSAFEAR